MLQGLAIASALHAAHRVVKSPRAQPIVTPRRAPVRFNRPEEIRARRIRRFVFLGTVVVCALGVAIYFAAPSIGGASRPGNLAGWPRQAFAMSSKRNGGSRIRLPTR